MIITVTAELLRDKSLASYVCGEVSPAVGDYILVKTEYGSEAAKCKTPPTSPVSQLRKFPQIIRVLTSDDIKRLKKLSDDEKADFKTVNELITKYEIPMKLAKVSYTFDKRRIFVYYTAQSRVDFREVIKAINSSLTTHVQMIQVSPVECARVIGGLGVCGRPFCCTLFSKRRSKGKYNVPSKALGPCGKILCCWQDAQNGE